MVLSRKRDRLAVDAGRAARAAASRRSSPRRPDLSDAPEVQDVVALLDVLVSPAHDLSLARALKSPLFGLERRRPGAAGAAAPREHGAGRWFDLLQKAGAAARRPLQGLGPRSDCAGKGWLDSLPPHDALQAIYDDGDVLARFAAAAPATPARRRCWPTCAPCWRRRCSWTAGVTPRPTPSCARSRPAACRRPRRPTAAGGAPADRPRRQGAGSRRRAAARHRRTGAAAPRPWACWWTGRARQPAPRRFVFLASESTAAGLRRRCAGAEQQAARSARNSMRCTWR